MLVAGAGELGRVVADKLLEHRELGYKVVGFVDDRAGGDHLGYRGLPLLGTLAEAADILQRERIDQLYVALPLDEHVKMLALVESANREIVEVKVVPDLLQVIALRGAPRGSRRHPDHQHPRRAAAGLQQRAEARHRRRASRAALLLVRRRRSSLIVAIIIRRTSPGPAFYRQERMGLDGKSFYVWKFRSMYDDAERETGPVWAREDDPRCTPIGRFLRRSSLDELPQLWNVLKGDMSLVGPRPERPFFVEQFKHRIPQYMLRHKVKAGLTGWAQVNGWRGNTSIEKRIEYDLYYIENWSVRLDLKIMWLTLVRGFLPQARLLSRWHESSSPARPVSSDRTSPKRCSIAA